MNFLNREQTVTNASVIGYLALGSCMSSLVLSLYPPSRMMCMGVAFGDLLIFYVCDKIDKNHLRNKQFSDLELGVKQ